VHYYGYRYYNPQLGRWVNRDPIGEKRLRQRDLYAFVRNNPQVLVAPDGRTPFLSAAGDDADDGGAIAPDLCSFVSISCKVRYKGAWFAGDEWRPIFPPAPRPFKLDWRHPCMNEVWVQVVPNDGFDAVYDPDEGNVSAPWTGGYIMSPTRQREWRYRPYVAFRDALNIRRSNNEMWRAITTGGSGYSIIPAKGFAVYRRDTLISVSVKLHPTRAGSDLGLSKECLNKTLTITH
jgi:uncharacterized protein RhaS with RHS repeats